MGEIDVDSEEEMIFNDGIIEYYQNRPENQQFENMPLVNFAAWYTKKSGKDNLNNKSDFKLLNNKGFISKKYVKNIIKIGQKINSLKKCL